MIKVDIGKECSDEYCKKAVKSISSILNRDYNVWGLPCIFEIDYKKDYFTDVLDCKTRNMIRKADKNQIQVKVIDKNDCLQSVHDINASSLFRQGRIMSEGYRKFPKHTDYTRNCNKHYWEFIGAFIPIDIGNEWMGLEETRLIAYISVLAHKELILISQILGHADYLKTGVMNSILFYTIKHIINRNRGAKYIQYGFWNSGGEGLRHFKKSMGFNPIDIREI